MAGLISNPNVDNTSSKKKHDKLINRGHEYHPSDPVTAEEIESPNKLVSSSKVDSVTYSSSIRVDNHIRNELQAMTILGFASSQREAIESLIQSWRESQPKESLRTLNAQIETLERKDIMLKQKK